LRIHTLMSTSDREGESGVSIPEFYAGRCVFITGGTGFIGKAVLEKLLRSCPDIAAVYVLARPKKGAAAQARINEMMAADVFGAAKAANPGCEAKVIAVPGDMTQDNMGIPHEMRKEIATKVSVVIHMAATVRFDEPIKVATLFNITGLENVMALVKSLADCRAFVHCSTAYTHCYREGKVEEQFYPPTCPPQKFQSLMELLDDEKMANAVAPRLTYPHPNTYTFTKCVGEEMVKVAMAEIPTCVVRPAIVMPAWKEPSPGWTNSTGGPAALHLAMGAGMFRMGPITAKVKGALVPVDMVVNTLIAAGWHCGVTHKEGPADPEVLPLIYHSTGTLKYTWLEMANTCGELWHKYPLTKMMVRLPSMIYTGFAVTTGESALASSLQEWSHWFWRMWSHRLPGQVMDVAAFLTGRKAFAVRAYNRIDKALAANNFFLTNFVDFGETKNTKLLHALMTAEDKRSFNPLMDGFNYDDYMDKYILGLRKHIAKEDNSPKALVAARSQLRRTWWQGLAVRMFFIYIALKAGTFAGMLPSWGLLSLSGKKRNLPRVLVLLMAIGQATRSLRSFAVKTVEFVDKLSPGGVGDIE